MSLFFNVLALVLWVYLLIVIARLVVEITRQFARAWRPAGVAAVGLEVVYLTTDPPLNAIRRVCPPVRIGNVSLDLSVMILLLAIIALRLVFISLASCGRGRPRPRLIGMTSVLRICWASLQSRAQHLHHPHRAARHVNLKNRRPEPVRTRPADTEVNECR